MEEARIHEIIRAQVSDRSRDIVEEVERAAAEHDLGVVGMKTNPHPKRAAGALKKAGIAYKCLEYGGYTGSWRRRNALKMWTGSPSLPMVFVKGTLIGGAHETLSPIDSG